MSENLLVVIDDRYVMVLLVQLTGERISHLTTANHNNVHSSKLLRRLSNVLCVERPPSRGVRSNISDPHMRLRSRYAGTILFC